MMYMNLQAPASKHGNTILVVMFIVLFLLLMAGALQYFQRHQAQYAFNYVDQTVAQYLCEAGIEHAMHMLANHANQFDESAPGYLDWNKKFAQETQFRIDLDPPFLDPLDAALGGELKKSLNESIAEVIPEGEVLSISISYRLSDQVMNDPLTAIGVLSIAAEARYRNARRKVVVDKEIYLHKNLPICFDHVIYINNQMKADYDQAEYIPGRRNRRLGKTGFWNSVGSFFTGDWEPQTFLAFGKVFIRQAVIYLNSTSASSFGGIGWLDSMIDKLRRPSVDPYTRDSKLGSLLGGLLAVEYDEGWGFSNGILNGAGGTRGNTDLTGIDPPTIIDRILQIFGKPINFKSNILVGDIQRRYALLRLGASEKVTEPYVTLANQWFHHVAEPSGLIHDETKYPKDRIPGLLEPSLYRKIAWKKPGPNKRETVVYKIGDKKVSRQVIKYYGWGPWTDAPSSGGFFGPLKDFFRAKTGKEAALANPKKYAIKLKGVEFIDGDVHIEGYYQGQGTIVATGTIFIGNELLRHPEDNDSKPFTEDDGDNNYLQLISLGTGITDPNTGEEVGGRIVFTTTDDPNFGQPGFFHNLFASKPNMTVDAFMYAKNGIRAEFEGRGWFNHSSQHKIMTSVRGNWVGWTLGVDDNTPNFPDYIMFAECPKWLALFEELMKRKDQIIVSFNPKIIRYWQGVSDAQQ